MDTLLISQYTEDSPAGKQIHIWIAVFNFRRASKLEQTSTIISSGYFTVRVINNGCYTYYIKKINDPTYFNRIEQIYRTFGVEVG